MKKIVPLGGGRQLLQSIDFQKATEYILLFTYYYSLASLSTAKSAYDIYRVGYTRSFY